MIEPYDATEALALIGESRAKLAAASNTPPVRHFVFAAMMGAYVATPAIPMPWRLAAFAVLMAAIVWVVRWDRRRMGMFINGYRRGKTRLVTAAVLALILPLYLAGFWLSFQHGLTLAPVAFGLVAMAIGYVGSLWWCRVFRRELLDVA